MNTVPNGVEDPETFQIESHPGITFAARKGCGTGVKDFMRKYPLLLSIGDGYVVVDWKLYGVLERDDTNDLNEPLLAAGVLTLDEKGSYRIRDVDDPRNRYFHGPTTDSGLRLFFNSDRLYDAFMFIRVCEHLVTPGPRLEVHECQEVAFYKKAERPAETPLG